MSAALFWGQLMLKPTLLFIYFVLALAGVRDGGLPLIAYIGPILIFICDLALSRIGIVAGPAFFVGVLCVVSYLFGAPLPPLPWVKFWIPK